MSLALVIDAVILVVVIIGLWAAYRVLGTPSRLAPADYRLVLDDLAASVARSAALLRSVLESPDTSREEVATETRKIFQTGYYQALRLKPEAPTDPAALVRAGLGRACEAYEWASRMVGSESFANQAVRDAAMTLLARADAELSESRQALAALPPPAQS
jgi:hypothetical protein